MKPPGGAPPVGPRPRLFDTTSFKSDALIGTGYSRTFDRPAQSSPAAPDAVARRGQVTTSEVVWGFEITRNSRTPNAT